MMHVRDILSKGGGGGGNIMNTSEHHGACGRTRG